MTPQQGAKLYTPLQDYETCRKMMKTTVQRTHTSQTVIKAFSRNRYQTSDECWADQMSPNAMLLMEDHAHLTVGLETQERFLLLFTDSLIIAKTKSLYLKLKARVSLCDIWLASCIHHVTSRKFSAKNSFVIGWPTTNYVVTLSSSEIKEKWLRALHWHSAKARQGLIPNRILLNVHLFDNTAMTPVTVDMHSTADSVVESVIQNNSLPGTVSKYQLCVGHDGEEETYPLIGHELPFCILLHTLRSAHGSTHTLKQPSDGLNANPLQKQPKLPRFTLKSRVPLQTHAHTGFSLKHKRKKSLLGWALRRGFSNQSEGKSDPNASKLFGQPLASVCLGGNLPRPVMDLLCVLYHEGPKTLGVFRRSANAKNCRVLKERLNSGHYISLHGESVFTAASLLTEFLRKLPGSVLGCELYEDWMEVMDTDDLQDRHTLAKSVLAKLPQENRSLLCYVFGMLHCIHKHADANQMTAANLALCIAPNMLWRSSPCTAEQESHNNLEVAALIRFLIESSPTIFGDEVESTFAALLSAAQETDDLTADASFLLHSSSEETDQDGLASPLHSPDLDCFLPLTTQHTEVHPLKISMAAEGAYSCGTLNLKSSRSSASVSSLGIEELSQSRNRCLSEPSMCPATSGTPVLPHIPVLRQSSCDNAVIDGKVIQMQDAREFSPLLQARKGGTGKGRYAFWKSPQFSARFRHPVQRLASMSSLSSTTTTSSLSSLDSAVSFSSAEPIPSPSDNTRPFLFGASARLRPLTPEMPRKLWKMAFTYEEQEAELRDGQNSSTETTEAKCLSCDCPLTLKDESKEVSKGEKEGEITVGGNQKSLAMMNVRDGKSEMKKKEGGETLVEGERVIDGERDGGLTVEERERETDIKTCSLESATGGLEGELPIAESVCRVEQSVCCLSSTETCLSRDDPECLCDTNTLSFNEGISQEDTHQLMSDNENWDLEHILSRIQPCPVHTHTQKDLCTQHTPTQTNPCSHSHRETSVAHVRLERPLSNSDTHTSQTSANIVPSVKGKVNRMKITFFPTVGRVMLKQSRIKSLRALGVTHALSADENGPGVKTGGVAQVNIPQTLFYRQNVPLVLHSAALGKPPSKEVVDDVGNVTDVKATEDDGSSGFSIMASTRDSVCAQNFSASKIINDNQGPDVGHKVSINASDGPGHTVSISRVDAISNSTSNSISLSPGHTDQPDLTSKVSSKGPRTFRHTIRIRLPTNVRNTVKAYFVHAHTIPHANAHCAASTHNSPKAQNRQLFSSKLQCQRSGANTPAHTEGDAAASLSDESFA
ncbi:uncharacterized protein arhgap20b [Salminus brasiliensis]|uniref:uncharacterized protein arhgap20b n=1 Tax=Salminus brasiliensis TaxID=930266 RepID=UPI003B83A26A